LQFQGGILYLRGIGKNKKLF